MRPSAATICTLLLVMFATGCSDHQPPAWPRNAALEAKEIHPHRVRLCWPPATDDRGVAGYRLVHGSRVFDRVEAAATGFTIDGLEDGTAHVFGLQAEDQAGNRSEPLRVEVTTPTAPSAVPDVPTHKKKEAVFTGISGVGGAERHGPGGEVGGGGRGIGILDTVTETDTPDTEKAEQKNHPVMHIASVEVAGEGIQVPGVRRVLASHRQRLLDCYRESLARDPGGSGTRSFVITIEGGAVSRVAPAGGKRQGSSLDTCLEATLRLLTLPGADGQVSVTLAFSAD